MRSRIDNIHAREILDSRGEPTVEVEVLLAGRTRGVASVPSGASKGRHEAVELRDEDPTRLGGRGVRLAVKNVNESIAPALAGQDASDQAGVDRLLCSIDGTSDKSGLGANAMLAVSLAVAHAAAAAAGLPLWRYLADGPVTLPLPMINIISGGLHAGGNLDFQDFMIVAVGAETYSGAVETSLEVHHAAGELLRSQGLTTLKADEGGYGPPLASNRAALELIMSAIERAGFRPGNDVAIAIDVAASYFYQPTDGLYDLRVQGGRLDAAAMVGLLKSWASSFPIVSIEDGLAEDDWEGWRLLTAELGSQVQLLGDDLFTTNPGRLQKGIESAVANAILIKMNQIGTLTETLEVISQAKRAGYATVVSARSGETEDATMADLAVATAAGQIKIGSLAQSERLAKYNQLSRIEEALGAEARFAGAGALVREGRR